MNDGESIFRKVNVMAKDRENVDAVILTGVLFDGMACIYVEGVSTK